MQHLNIRIPGLVKSLHIFLASCLRFDPVEKACKDMDTHQGEEQQPHDLVGGKTDREDNVIFDDPDIQIAYTGPGQTGQRDTPCYEDCIQ